MFQHEIEAIQDKIRSVLGILHNDIYGVKNEETNEYEGQIIPQCKGIHHLILDTLVSMSKDMRTHSENDNDNLEWFAIRDYITKFYYDAYEEYADGCDKDVIIKDNTARKKSIDKITSILFHKTTHKKVFGRNANSKFYDAIHKDKSTEKYMIMSKKLGRVLFNKYIPNSTKDILWHILSGTSAYKKDSFYCSIQTLVNKTGYTRKMVKNVISDLTTRNIIALSKCDRTTKTGIETTRDNESKDVITLNPDFYANPMTYFLDVYGCVKLDAFRKTLL